MSSPILLEKNTQILPADRLVVLLPEYTVDLSTLGRIIRDLALRHVSKVFLLTVVKEPFAGVHMAHVQGYLYAVTHDPFLHVETSVQVETTWLRAIRAIWQPGDLFLCLSDHMVRWGVFWQKPIAELITQQIDAPVYVITVENGLEKV